MRNWIWMLAVLATLSFGTALSAQEDEKPEKAPGAEEKEGEGEEKEGEEEVDYLAQIKSQFKDVDKVVGTVTITDADLKSYQKYEKEFDDFVDTDPKFEELTDKSIKDAFDYAVKSEKYLAWAKARELNGEDWLRKACRIMTFSVRSGMTGSDMDEQIDGLKEMKKMVEKMKDQMPAEDLKESLDQLDKSIAQMEGMRDFGKTLPEPTEAEAKLLKAAEEAEAKEGEGDESDEEEMD